MDYTPLIEEILIGMFEHCEWQKNYGAYTLVGNKQVIARYFEIGRDCGYFEFYSTRYEMKGDLLRRFVQEWKKKDLKLVSTVAINNLYQLYRG